MKRLLLSLWVVALLCAASSAPLAQDTDDFEKELQAFQKKTANGAGDAASQQPAPPGSTPAAVPSAAGKPAGVGPLPPGIGTSPVTRSAPAVNAAPSMGMPLGAPMGTPLSAGQGQNSPAAQTGNDNNPLGPAGNLPLGRPRPATANALGMQVPIETQAELEAKAAEQKKKFDEKVFQQALGEILPMTPEEIRRMLQTFKASRQAAETPITDPVPKVEVVTVSLDPSQVPPVIKTAPWRVSTLIILDSTGAPWPIQDVSWAGKFEITPPEEGGHVVRITPQSAHTMGNISIRLVDLVTPITFTLQTGLDEVDYRFDARIPKLGPLAKIPLIEHGGLKTVVGGDENLVQILDGTPPSSSERLRIEGTDGRTSVWRLSGRIYLRTPLTLLSPAWSSSVSSGDGMNVYVLNDTPVILLSDEGRMVRASIAASEVTP